MRQLNPDPAKERGCLRGVIILVLGSVAVWILLTAVLLGIWKLIELMRVMWVTLPR